MSVEDGAPSDALRLRRRKEKHCFKFATRLHMSLLKSEGKNECGQYMPHEGS